MKKLLCLLLAALILVPAAACADASEFLGGWCNIQGYKNIFMSVESFYFCEDGTLFYAMTSVYADDKPTTRNNVGTWTETETGVHMIYGRYLEGDAEIVDGYLVLSLDPAMAKLYYGRVMHP